MPYSLRARLTAMSPFEADDDENFRVLWYNPVHNVSPKLAHGKGSMLTKTRQGSTELSRHLLEIPNEHESREVRS